MKPLPFTANQIRALKDSRFAAFFLPTTTRQNENFWAPSVWALLEPGERIWVQEKYAARLTEDGNEDKNRRYVKYAADRADGARQSPYDPMDWHTWPDQWTEATNMPRWASRYELTMIKQLGRFEDKLLIVFKVHHVPE